MINSQYQNRNNITNFTWIPFYKELANKLLEYQNNRIVLINKIKDIFSEMSHLELPTLERDNNIIDIDPFTVLGLFNKGITNNNRIELLLLFKKHFDLISEIPIDFSGVPVLNNQKSTFYYFLGDRKDNDIDNLWILFKTAINYEKTQAQQIATEFNNIFNIVKDQQGVRWNITMGLFWIAPNIYINLDSKNRNAIQKAPFISDNLKKKLKLFGCNLPDGSSYLNFCQQLNRELQMNVHGINNFSEFSFYADRITNNDGNNEKPFDLKANTTINIPLNQILYGPPGTGKTYNTVVKAIEITKPELIQRDKNGNVKNYDELKIEFDKLRHQGQIEFVTFHQSYSYEEFVECIKPEIQKWNDEGSELKYVGKDGVFKNICEHAKPVKVSAIKHQPIDFSNTKVFKMSLGNTLKKEDDIYEYCISHDVVALGFKDVDFSDCKTSQDFKDKDKEDPWGATALERFINWIDIGDIIIVSNGNRKFRAIAQVTGNYYYDRTTPIRYSHFRKVKWLYKGEDIYYSKINNKVFSQQSIYGYFDPSKKGMPNYNPDLNTQELNNIITGKVDKEIALPHILIIDEINRGNISKIFGELITLIEEDKRGTLSVKLPYSQDDFTVPQNLYIIGTMNTSDRSIASIDIALRRRFKFVEMMPKPELVADFGCGFKTIFEKLNTKIKVLLDRDHQIGHSYFINTKYANADINTLKEIWFSEIIPLLNEYFYCDWEKLKLVVPGFIKTVNNIPEELKNECEDSIYEFKTPDEVQNFESALNQDKFKQEN